MSMTRSRVVLLSLTFALVVGLAAPAMAGGAKTDQVTNVESSLDVSLDPPIAASLTCKFVKRVELPDGSAKETQNCNVVQYFEVGDGPTFTPVDFKLKKAFVVKGGECEWFSDYWFAQQVPSAVAADSYQYTVTPSGNVSVESHYPAVPIDPFGYCGF